MGKNKKNKSFGKNMKFITNNRTALAALGGFAAGITVAGILGSDKAKQIADTIGTAVKEYGNKVKESLVNEGSSNGSRHDYAQ
jgi:hypothetical protein